MFVMFIVFVVCRNDDCRMQLKPFSLNIARLFQNSPNCDPKQGCNGKISGNRSRDITCTDKVLTMDFCYILLWTSSNLGKLIQRKCGDSLVVFSPCASAQDDFIMLPGTIVRPEGFPKLADLVGTPGIANGPMDSPDVSRFQAPTRQRGWSELFILFYFHRWQCGKAKLEDSSHFQPKIFDLKDFGRRFDPFSFIE